MDLLQEVKDECGITWSDEITDREVDGIITRAKARLDDYAGGPCDYDNGSERQLLLTLCRYIYNKAAEEFKRNCSEDIIALRQKYQARRAIKAEEAETDADT